LDIRDGKGQNVGEKYIKTRLIILNTSSNIITMFEPKRMK
jgi:hypothetical protein